MRYTASLLICFLCLGSAQTYAAGGVYQSCILAGVATEATSSFSELKEKCIADADNLGEDFTMGLISERILQERATQWNRFVITPHKRNYILPVVHTDKVNRQAYQVVPGWPEGLKHYEAEYQLSIKVPLNSRNLIREGDALYFGFTVNSWWQVYAGEISAPFRETNYQPEIFYLTGLDWKPLGGNTGLYVGFEHQSNGRSQLLSRSWNRIYAGLIYEKDNLALGIQPWYRLKEDPKRRLNAPSGDDNPDIEKFLGHFEFSAAYKSGKYEFSFMGRNNLRSDNKGAFELGMSFPLGGPLKGFVQYFNGYGENLIDYNISQERIGLGLMLTDIF